jgi:RNA polymerase sigma-70 factor (ECF subfamily)
LKPFETAVLVHLDAAYNLARWMLRDASAAEDAVQEACLRACRYFDTHHGAAAKAWLLAIVRNVCLDALSARKATDADEAYDDEVHGGAESSLGESPEHALARESEARWLRRCISSLPQEYREVIVLRELEELSYREIGAIVDVPVGTVMSRLARARDLLQQRLTAQRRRHGA